ncbi:ATP-grasp ribosomal peptide maturase [Paractinoplanes durhamensis]|uniref:ATP-grasp ribosomal peptide maturase n=1 Tax=Paractinoplanes durhamensis TaxID=113563 RepID=A0ABQ3Z3K5_9ACTN|nr:ATP-grasp ribosomal peptide maturase [Actinoplanes durhamensis]GIE04124.1 ATP-grasp ribosomal peptide maturase [Actinoplanes durhamensis]
MNTSDTVLILTCAEDSTADAVTAELARRDTRVARMDTGDFPTALRMSATTADGGWTGRLATDDTSVDLDDVRSVYFRRPTRFRLPAGMSAADEVFAAVEARHGFGGLLAALDVLWVNEPIRQAAAEYKPLQLATAAACGLRTPATLLTNLHQEVIDFGNKIGGPVVCKQLSSLVFSENDEMRTTYTTVIDPATIEPAAFAATAHLIQEFVPKAYEARVTVVGRIPLGVVIRSASEAGRIDWRSDYDALTYERIKVPEAVTDGVGRFLDALGLNYGAFDFVITPDGDWVMLECNPAGQWLWLEHETGVPIAAALADLLTEGRDR